MPKQVVIPEKWTNIKERLSQNCQSRHNAGLNLCLEAISKTLRHPEGAPATERSTVLAARFFAALRTTARF